MTDEQLPDPIAAFVRATNDADPDAFAAAFTEDAELNDWGRVFHGRDGVRSWDGTDNIGVHSRFAVVGWHWEAPGTAVVELTVTGDGYNGTGPMTFTLRDGLIASLVIAPTD
jgi:hypothetical protein